MKLALIYIAYITLSSAFIYLIILWSKQKKEFNHDGFCDCDKCRGCI